MAATGGPNGLQTMTDLELRGLDGSKMDAAVRAKQRAQAIGVSANALAPEERAALTLTWADLKVRHTSYDLKFWQECRALYAGGPRLLQNDEVLERLFPSNLYEDPDVYKERKRRAHYFPYAGTILDALVAGLGSDPLRVSFAIADEETGELKTPPAAEWWERWVGDVTGESTADDEDQGGDETGCSLHEFMTRVVREAEQVRTAWILCEIPDDEDPIVDGAPPGDRDPALRILPAETVIDWQEGKDHCLEYVLTLEERQVRKTLRARRGVIEQTYTLWTPTSWVRYVVEFDPAQPPNDDAPIVPTLVGEHGFEEVPVLRFELPEGMWGMGKMHSLSREHFNKRCAMSWAEYKSLFPILYEFNGNEDGANGMPVPAAQRDRGRSLNQIRAQGYSQLRGNEDRAEFVGPAAEAFVAAREGCKDTMREMHRVMYSMALSADMGTQAMARSGESKKEDKQPTEVILDFIGLLVRYGVRSLLALIARGKATTLPGRKVQGLEHFDTQGVQDAIDEATTLFAGVPMKSARFVELYLADTYAKILGDVATQKDRETIRAEVRDQVNAEELLAAAGMLPTAAGPLNGEREAIDPEDEDEKTDKGGDDDEPIAANRGRGGPMFSSSRKKRG